MENKETKRSPKEIFSAYDVSGKDNISKAISRQLYNKKHTCQSDFNPRIVY